MAAACIFCKIIKGDIPSFKLFENDRLLAFLDIQPLSLGHALVVPKHHGAKLTDIPDDSLTEILVCICLFCPSPPSLKHQEPWTGDTRRGREKKKKKKKKKKKQQKQTAKGIVPYPPVVKKLAVAMDAENFNVLQNNGRLAHQEVDHVHFHMIPKPNQAEGLGIEWPAQKTDMDKLKALFEEVKAKM